MAGTKGNRNAAHDKPWTRAIQRAVAQNPDALRKAAEMLLLQAENGNKDAFKELGDRLDGKPLQSIEHSGNLSNNPDTLTDAELAAIATGSSPTPITEAPSAQKLN